MKGMIFAAGIGSRLKPWTDKHPKALMPLDGKPALQKVIERFIQAGIHDIVVNVHHFGEQIYEHLATTNYEANIKVSDENSVLLDTGGGLRKALPLFSVEEPILVHNADILSDFPITELIQVHKASGYDTTLATQARDSTRRLLFNRENGLLRGWLNISSGQTKPEGFVPQFGDEMLCYNGAFIISPSMFQSLLSFQKDGIPFSIIDFFLAQASDSRIGHWNIPDSCTWFDIGTPEKLEKANIYLATQKR